jgi:hypothetical protein
MSEVPKPTPQDMARDLAADLQLTDAAPGGPWAFTSATNYLDGRRGEEYTIAPADDPDSPVFRWFEPDDMELDEEDRLPLLTMEAAEMIAASVEGWPAAVRRALAAEAKVAGLLAACEACHALLLALPATVYDDLPPEKQAAYRAAAELARAAIARALGA